MSRIVLAIMAEVRLPAYPHPPKQNRTNTKNTHDNERSSRREMSLRVLPCSKWRRHTRACSLAVMRGVLEAFMSTRSATMWAKLQAVGIKRLWTQLMDVENLTCMSPSDR